MREWLLLWSVSLFTSVCRAWFNEISRFLSRVKTSIVLFAPSSRFRTPIIWSIDDSNSQTYEVVVNTMPKCQYWRFCWLHVSLFWTCTSFHAFTLFRALSLSPCALRKEFLCVRLRLFYVKATLQIQNSIHYVGLYHFLNCEISLFKCWHFVNIEEHFWCHGILH